MVYQLSHPLDRPGQQAAFDWLMSTNKKFLIVCAPTGSGKSAWAAAASIENRVIVLTETKSLQTTNYRGIYNFNVLTGKANYLCEDEENKKLFWTAFDCGNPECECPYNRQVTKCLNSNRVSLNYAKYLMSGSFVEDYEPDILFLDEAHNLDKIVTEYIGLTIEWSNEFIQRRTVPKERMQLNFREAMTYFNQVIVAVNQNKPPRPEVRDRKQMDKWRRWKRLNQRIKTVESIISGGDLRDWYYEVDEKKLLLKPLTAKYHFWRLFGKASKVILMSATIKPSIAEKLGIDDNDFEYYEVLNPWPAPMRVVYDLGCPKMNYSCSDEDRDVHARKIAAILSDRETGTIHVSSKQQAYDLSDRLLELGVNTCFPTDGIGTDNQLQEWYNRRKPGLYCIAWSFHEGVDLGDDDISITAKVPYPPIDEGYNYAKMQYDVSSYLQSAAYLVEQSCGRPRRGNREHYGSNGKKVYIADGSWHRLKSRLSPEFRKAIRKWNGNR
jgi:Rad3-related DNA helicase